MGDYSEDRPKTDIGTMVRRRRKALGLTQHQVAELSGCHIDFLSDLERGKRTVRLDKVEDVLNVLGLKLAVVTHAN